MALAKIFILLFIMWALSVNATKSEIKDPENHNQQGCFCSVTSNLVIHSTAEDSLIFDRVMGNISANTLGQTAIAEIIIQTAKLFLSTPYVAHTLEINEDERLVINLRGMDCTTFVEYVTAFALLASEGGDDFERFAQLLACIRYRHGFPDGYPSRLHYFTDWLQNNAQKGIIEIISDALGSKELDTRVFFMSSNPHFYRQLKDTIYLKKIAQIEKEIANYKMRYIPKEQIQGLENKIRNGDIIAFVTNIKGLDISHNGFAYHLNGRLHLLHASTLNHKVEFTPIPLSEYIKPMQRVTGIIVGRLREK